MAQGETMRARRVSNPVHDYQKNPPPCVVLPREGKVSVTLKMYRLLHLKKMITKILCYAFQFFLEVFGEFLFNLL